ncbi:MAG: sulfite exporter TauE/SafE family protein [Candidatus Sericytochromatia bacterium]|nr:sulfite exporter TauE/SafE family protein [Candidatus Sericytochromatia bacterium]
MEYFLLFTAGIFSSMHCIGMCGCFVTAYSMNIKGHTLQKAIAHLLYSFGRITTYTLLGAIMGFIGSSMFFLAKMAGIQNWIIVFAGVAMIYLGATQLGLVPKIPLLTKFEGTFFKKFGKYYYKLSKKQGIIFTYPLGVVLGFLPCCLLYTVEMQAMSTGSPIKGALSMFFFGLGTIPSMFSFGMIVNLINNKLKQRVLNLASYVIMILGFMSIYRGAFQ